MPDCIGRGTAPTAVPTVQQRGRQLKPLSVLCTPLEPPAPPRLLLCGPHAHTSESNGRTAPKIGREEEKIHQKEGFEYNSKLGVWRMGKIRYSIEGVDEIRFTHSSGWAIYLTYGPPACTVCKHEMCLIAFLTNKARSFHEIKTWSYMTLTLFRAAGLSFLIASEALTISTIMPFIVGHKPTHHFQETLHLPLFLRHIVSGSDLYIVHTEKHLLRFPRLGI